MEVPARIRGNVREAGYPDAVLRDVLYGRCKAVHFFERGAQVRGQANG